MDETLQQLFDAAKNHFLRHEYAQARTLLEQICAAQTGYADVYHMLGVVLHDAGLFSKAQEAFERCLQINPRFTEAALNLSVLYNDLGRYDEARETYGRALAYCRAEAGGLDPFVAGKIANMHADIGDAYRNAHRLDAAGAQYRAALQLRPGFADLRLRLATVLQEQQQHEAAKSELHRAIADRPDYMAARVQLGICCYSMGEHDQARRHWQSVIEHEPDNAAASMYLRMAGTGADAEANADSATTPGGATKVRKS